MTAPLTLADICEGRVPIPHHALLLVGSRLPEDGLAAADFRALAQTLCGIRLGHTPTDESDQTFWALAGSHPDVVVVNREAATIKLEDIAPLRERSLFPPTQGHRRLFFLDRCERLPAASANALLKVLEEPGAPCLFLFTGRSLRNVLPTIASRCFRLAVRFPEDGPRSPLEALELADADSLRALFVSRKATARALREIVERADALGRKYEAPTLMEACLAAALEAHRAGRLALPILRYVKEDLRAWREALVFHPSAGLWLCRLLLRLIAP